MNLKENIKRMEKELADMKKQLEQQEKLELKGGEGYTLQGGYKPDDTENALRIYIRRGAFRATKELAEIADKNMVTRNRLEAYVHYIQCDGEGNHYIQKTEGYYVVRSKISKAIGAVYMQKETAEIICKALNNSEIKL